MDYLPKETDLVEKLFDLKEILEFQKTHDLQIIRCEDWSYMLYIDKQGYGSSLTPMGALVIGVRQFKTKG